MILDELHGYVYSIYSDDENEQIYFENLLTKRYEQYGLILMTNSDHMPHMFGMEFAENFLGVQPAGNALPFIFASAEIFFHQMNILKQFLDETLAKYEITIN